MVLMLRNGRLGRMATPAEIRESALSLPRRERARLASELLGSLDEEPPAEDQSSVQAAWGREIDRRVASIEDGTAEYVDHDVAMREVRDRLEAQRRSR